MPNSNIYSILILNKKQEQKMKKVIILVAIATVFASCASESNTNSGLLGGDSAVISVDSTELDSVVYESMVLDTFTSDSVN